MARKKLEEIKAGNVGFFWPQLDDSLSLLESEKERGYLAQDTGETAYIRTLEEDPSSRFFSRVERPTIARPKAIAGQLEDGGILALDLSGRGASTRIGGTRASLNKYRARILIGNAPLERLNSSLLFGAQVHFPGISSWVGNETNSVETDFHENGRQKGVKILVRSPDPLTLDIGDGFELDLGMHWQLDGPDDRRTLYAGSSDFRVRGLRSAAASGSGS